MMWKVMFVFAFVAYVSAQSTCSFCGPNVITADNLPSYVGPNPFPFNSSTGYIKVNTTYERYNFYWLIESQSGHPDSDPLVFWYQGGPGCSGLAGLFTEHGPFRVGEDGNVNLAQFTWNQFANIVYLEQPTSVGFSASTISGYQYYTGDRLAAQDNFAFIEGFLKQNPKFLGRQIWLAGESYGGVYIPTLAYEILQNPTSDTYQQFHGMMLGNPVFSCSSLNEKDLLINNLYWHTLISQETYNKWIEHGCPSHSSSALCDKIFTDAFRQVGRIDQEIGGFTFNGTQPSLDPDDLYQDFILGNQTLEWMLTLMNDQVETVDELAIEYLNRDDVQSVLNTLPPPGGEWDICVSRRVMHYTSTGASMIPYYLQVFTTRPDVHVFIYSGDIDIATVPAPQTMKCMVELQGSLQKEWAPWFVNGATAGYVEYYQQYTYATVKGAGHTVPTYQPLTSYNLFSRYIQNQNLDGGEVFFPSAKALRRRVRQSDMLRAFGIRT